jgi:hypothetical protein
MVIITGTVFGPYILKPPVMSKRGRYPPPSPELGLPIIGWLFAMASSALQMSCSSTSHSSRHSCNTVRFRGGQEPARDCLLCSDKQHSIPLLPSWKEYFRSQVGTMLIFTPQGTFLPAFLSPFNFLYILAFKYHKHFPFNFTSLLLSQSFP